MTKIWSDDRSLYATIGKNKAGEYSATIYMAEEGDPNGPEYYPPIGINKFDGYVSKEAAIKAAKDGMARVNEDDEEVAA